MSGISNLSDEALYQRCQEMNLTDLIELADSHARVSEICSDIIRNRKRERKERGMANRMQNMNRSIRSGTFRSVGRSNPEGSTMFVSTKPKGEDIEVTQEIYGDLEESPWILPGTSYERGFDKQRRTTINQDRIDELIDNLNREKYEQIYY